MAISKAELHELDASFGSEINPEHNTVVQFNPESVKVSYSNQIVQPPGGGGDNRGAGTELFVGTGATKLACQLVFDVTQELPAGAPATDDVRHLTEKVAYFITPHRMGDKLVPPAARFLWGSFQFDGIVESLDESLEFFSPEGKPLRATMSLSMTQQRITNFAFRPVGGGAAATAGTQATVEAPDGSTVQGLATKEGRDWKQVAAGNGIENPRRLQAGQRIDLEKRAK
jgi:hypothetical protein